MSFISDNELEEVRRRAEIVQVVGDKVVLKRAGRNFQGLCPFHQEKSPSFSVNPEKQIYYCFGCGVGGDVFNFLMKLEGLTFVEAVERLADRFGVTITQKDAPAGGLKKSEKDLLFRVNQLALQFYHNELVSSEKGARGRDYLRERGIKEETLKEALLGYAPSDGKSLYRLLQSKKVPLELAEKLGLLKRGTGGDYYDFFRDRLLSPILNPQGQCLGFSGRALQSEVMPKYLNSPECPIYHKGDSFLGMSMASAAIREKDRVVLVEGNFDFLRLYQEGIRYVVAPLGTALTESQVRTLTRLSQNFVLIFDGDKAGIRAAQRALEIFLPMGLFPRAVWLPEGEDPDTWVKKYGVVALEEKINQAPSLLESRIGTILGNLSADVSEKAKAIGEARRIIGLLPGDTEKRLVIQKMADKYRISESYLSGSAGTEKKKELSSNFPIGKGEDRLTLPPLEKILLGFVLSGKKVPVMIFEAVQPEDFSHPQSILLWKLVHRSHIERGTVDVVWILAQIQEAFVTDNDGLRKLVTELAMSGNRLFEMGNALESAGKEEENADLVKDYIQKWRSAKLKERLMKLSQKIREAELENDVGLVQQLLKTKDELLKEKLH